ncbi:MAG: hypothetical protein K6E91_05780 [Butyrivibrio sp.]|nr:hypothetical protein [Butyrivibrio sp.]
MSVNEEIREQQKKLKDMTLKARIAYFWEYYKIHTIIAVAAIIFIVTIVRDIANNKPYALYAMFINVEATDSQYALQDGFAEFAGIDTAGEAVLVDTNANFLSSTTDSSAVATSEKAMAVISAKTLDVMLADENSFAHFAGQETFMPLTEYFSQDELKELSGRIFYMDQSLIDYLMSDQYTDYILTNKYDESNKYAKLAAEYQETFVFPIMDYEDMENPVPVGIILENSAPLTDTGAYVTKTPIAGIVTNTQHKDNAKKFIQYLMQ